MKEMLTKGQFTTFGPDEIWKLYSNLNGIFRGGSNTTSPKLVRADGPRKSDLLILYDSVTDQEMVYPDSTKGLSFSDSVQTLAGKKIEGWVWIIPKGTELPDDLVFNIKDYDHPLLNVSKIISVLEMTVKLTQLASLMKPCYVKIDKFGNITEKYPGALAKVAQL